MTTATAARRAAAGRPTMPRGHIRHTIPWSLRITAASQVTRQTISGDSHTGVASTDTTAPEHGGQTSHVRFGNAGGKGTLWYFPEIATNPLNMVGRYLRTRLRRNDGPDGNTLKMRWRFADTKTAHDAGNYAEFNVAPNDTATNGTANYLPEGTFVWDGVPPELCTPVGSGVADWSNVRYLALFIQQNAGAPVWDLAELQLVTRTAEKAKCVIWHDDSVIYGAQALHDRMSVYGFPWEEASEWEMPLFAPASQLLTWDAYGVKWGTHATTNPEHNQNTPSQLQNQAIRNRLASRRLHLIGDVVEDQAWWGGQTYTEDFLNVIRAYYRTGRGNTSGIKHPEMIPPAEPWLYKAILTNTGATQFIDLWKPAIDAAIATKGLVTFIIHQDLGNSTPASDQFRANFDQLLDYLNSHRLEIDVTTTPGAFASCT